LLCAQLYQGAAVVSSPRSECAEAELRRWRDTEPNAAKRRRALARIEAALEGHDPV
jgi:hypothetical protein